MWLEKQTINWWNIKVLRLASQCGIREFIKGKRQTKVDWKYNDRQIERWVCECMNGNDAAWMEQRQNNVKCESCKRRIDHDIRSTPPLEWHFAFLLADTLNSGGYGSCGWRGCGCCCCGAGAGHGGGDGDDGANAVLHPPTRSRRQVLPN